MSETFKNTVSGLIIIAAILLSSSSYAIVLDWNNVTWTSGSLSASYELDASNPGNDITITITGNTGQFISGRPEITTDFTGGFGSSPSPDNLELWVDFANRSQSITVTVTFNYAAGVNEVNFLLFDVDTGSGGGNKTFIDQIREISAVGTSGSLVAPTITTSANNSKSGSGTNQVVSGTDENSNNSGDGNVKIDFGTNYITSFTFEYGNPSSGVQKNPDSQSIGIYDINYKPKVPEFHPGMVAFIACLTMVGLKRVFVG